MVSTLEAKPLLLKQRVDIDLHGNRMCEILNAFHALVESKRIYSKDLKVWDLVPTKPVVFLHPFLHGPVCLDLCEH